MGTKSFVLAGCFALTSAAACGGSTSGDGMMGATGATENDVTTYQQLAQNVQSAAIRYRASMTGAEVTLASCQAVHDGYDAQVRPWLAQMMQMAGEMDDVMGAHDGAMAADMRCVSDAMMADLDRHRAMACTFADLPDDRAEAARHTGAMVSYTGHMSDRSSEMMSGMHGGRWSWGSMMEGCQGRHADGVAAPCSFCGAQHFVRVRGPA